MAADRDAPARGMPSLLRAARATYARSVTRALTEGGFDDVPRHGAFVLAGGPPRTSATVVQNALGITKQAASGLIDTLVLRGYLQRHPHPSDRRRTELALTNRGHGAAEAIRRGVGAVDHDLAHRLPDGDLARLRAALELLARNAPDHSAPNPHTGPDPGPAPAPAAAPGAAPVHLTRVAPIFPVTDTDRAAAHYTALGFRVEPYSDGGYGFAQRDGVGIHLSLVPDLDPTTNYSAIYLYVSDADELATQWSHLAGDTHPPVDTDYRMREGAHRDPDGNLIRFGTPQHPQP